MPIGGLKEKVLAARRAGITTVVIPKLNKKELDEIPAVLKRAVEIHLVDDVEEALRLALVPPFAPRATEGAGPKASTKAFPGRPRSRPVTV